MTGWVASETVIPSPGWERGRGEGAPLTRKRHDLPKAEPLAAPPSALAFPHPSPLPAGRGSACRLSSADRLRHPSSKVEMP